ncbi:MAG: tRNA preQ1(34) S-adenosylmethionine ribosyltransferase-isomerase QueA [Endomicrobia bacterium]|nr:tRNA preQ1(34) S-adenosylmethionine ribosyltransferase-isomerase QueA [Endomicrobiia bacterium]
MNLEIDTSLYDFYLPKHLIAQLPSEKRAESRLLVYEYKKDKVKHLLFKDIVGLLDKRWCVVFNDTRVEKRKLYFKKPTDGVVPVLITYYDDGIIKCLPSKRLKIGQELKFGSSIECVVKDKNTETGEVFLEGKFTGKEISLIIDKYGLAPLPPYIKRTYNDSRNIIDLKRYQTIYAKKGCSLAAPTAGFHFDENIIKTLKENGVEIFYITLDIGFATFKPIKTNKITEHKLLPEHATVSKEVAEGLNKAINQGKKILCVGTTVIRTLEYLATKFGSVIPYDGPVDIYIYPGYKFKVTNAIVTNFHLPKSTNLVLIAAFVGREKLLELYNIAIENNYRFYSYGDAMLII